MILHVPSCRLLHEAPLVLELQSFAYVAWFQHSMGTPTSTAVKFIGIQCILTALEPRTGRNVSVPSSLQMSSVASHVLQHHSTVNNKLISISHFMILTSMRQQVCSVISS